MKRAGWSARRITLTLFPFGAGAMALNVYFASLIFSWFGAPVISPSKAIMIGLPLGLPATWLFARHIRTLIDQSEAE